MAKPEIAPYGSWSSPITSDLIAAKSITLGQVALDGEEIYWIEQRPTEGGRNVLVRRTPDGRTSDVNPAPFNARTRVHEYGGGAFAVVDGTAYFSNFADQRFYRQDRDAVPQPLTPDVDLRYADGLIDRRRGRMIAVREDHTVAGRRAANALVSVDLEGDEAGGRILAGGNDFYSTPRLSPDGVRLAWLTWNHPNMPWDGTELWVGEIDAGGLVRSAERVAGGLDESVFQPEWSPDGILHFISDRTGWWNLYRLRAGGIEPLCEMAAEFGVPQWVFGQSTYAFESSRRIICAYKQGGTSHLASLDMASLALEHIELPYTEIAYVRAQPGRAVFTAGSATEPASVVLLDLKTRRFEVLRRASDVTIDPGYLSIPEAIEFPTQDGLTAHGFLYRPRNRDYIAPPGESPPLLVKVHGGPTGSTSTTFNLGVQYWTSRGFAVFDVNYGGSTGYGRDYRRRLNRQWGVVDVNDAVNGTRYLVERGEADGRRLAIAGGSAGGYTTLAVLTFRSLFQAGASHYGVSDLEALARDTHKFESRYLDGLVGPYPERRDLYHERSPIYHTDRLSAALIVFQGLEDKVVPPNQAERIVEAVRKKGLPVAYVPFEGEQHGFRRAENIKRALDGELYFYSKVFGFDLADPVEPVHIDNL